MMWQDIRTAGRIWRRRPVTAISALLTVALATGMNVALFQLVWSVLLRPLPYPHEDRLVKIWRVERSEETGNTPRDRMLPAGFTIERWQQPAATLESVASFRPWRVTVGSGGSPERVSAGLVSAQFFDVLGVRPVIGRTFQESEIQPGSDTVAVLAHSYWVTRFAADPSMPGRTILIDGESFRVVGVLPPDYRGEIVSTTAEPLVYVPISRAARKPFRIESAFVAGRLKPGVTGEAAQAELAAAARQAAVAHGEPVMRHGVSVY